MTILTEVNEIEGKVVDTVRSLQRPVVDYVRKGVDLAEGVLPKLPYPENLPKPTEVVSSQIDFAKALLDAQRDFVSEIIEAVSPLVRGSGATPPPATVTTQPRVETDAVGADDVAGETAEPAPKTAATPAAKAATKRSTTRKTTRSPKAGA